MGNCELPGRRSFIVGAAALAATAASIDTADAQAGATTFIDVHHHYSPPQLGAAAGAYYAKRGIPTLGGPVGNWTPAQTIEEMDKNNIRTSILSLASISGLWFDVPRPGWSELARQCNEYATGMSRNYPGRFGVFATLPMPDVDASLKEIAYSFDVLKVDGIGLPTSFGDTWPGEPAYAPVWEELNRRKAIVVFHPTAATCCTGNFVRNVPESFVEYPYDTGHAVTSLLFGGAFARHRDVRWTFCHSGGPIPVLADRIETLAKLQVRNLAQVAPDGVAAELKRLYYDTANGAYAAPMSALLSVIPVSQIMFGTDYPYVSAKQNVDAIMARKLPAATLAAIARDNATRLIPRLRSS
jgi:6-methylsalicylate decarboxylase